jgi:DNA gyrase inhibitor GyrI
MRIIAVLLFFCGLWVQADLVAAAQTIPYEVVEKSGSYEIRHYPALVLVETPLNEGSFNRLFRYIQGENDGKQTIPMTAPVFMSHEKASMAFVLPVSLALPQTPIPSDSSLQPRIMTAGRFAVYRFSGLQSRASEQKAWGLLQDFLKKRNLEGKTNSLLFAYYDPPWILPFLRRNEVMTELKPSP